MTKQIVAQEGAQTVGKSGQDGLLGGLQGAGPSNTHPANRQPAETGGEDTAVLSLGVTWKRDCDAIFRALGTAKEKAKACHSMVPVSVGDVLVGVHPSGHKSGTVYFPYRVETRGFVFFIREGRCDDVPTVRVEIGSLLLMSCGGLAHAWAECRNVLESMGGYVLWNKLSRLDMCVDLPGVDVDTLVRLVSDRQAVCRAREKNYHELGERFTGVTVGHGDILVRMYDKLHEVQTAKPDPRKLELLEAFRWGGPQECAARVEFQLRREALKSLGVSCIRDYLQKRGELLRYLTSDWFRLVDEVPDRENNNTGRAGLHPLWVHVCEKFQAWAGTASTAARRAGRRLSRDPVRLVKQAIGCLMSAVSDLVEGRDMLSSEFVIKASECVEFILNDTPEGEFLNRYRRKALPVVLARVAA